MLSAPYRDDDFVLGFVGHFIGFESHNHHGFGRQTRSGSKVRPCFAILKIQNFLYVRIRQRHLIVRMHDRDVEECSQRWFVPARKRASSPDRFEYRHIRLPIAFQKLDFNNDRSSAMLTASLSLLFISIYLFFCSFLFFYLFIYFFFSFFTYSLLIDYLIIYYLSVILFLLLYFFIILLIFFHYFYSLCALFIV